MNLIDTSGSVDLAHVVLGIVVVFLGFWRARDSRSKGLIDSAIKLVLPLQKQIGVLETTVETLGTALTTLQGRVADLEFENAQLIRWGRVNFGRVIELGGDPEPMPDILGIS